MAASKLTVVISQSQSRNPQHRQLEEELRAMLDDTNTHALLGQTHDGKIATAERRNTCPQMTLLNLLPKTLKL